MNFKKVGLSVAAFAIAIAGAFATNSRSASAGDGYTNLQQVPSQGSPCVYRQTCAGGFNTCRVTISGKLLQLLQLEPNGTCSSTVLSQP
ncbi:hypothetical protein GO495_15420 [Chitinophaga oryziterrae]|uniref:Uncharacterized protein n=1 Tax=Chitinophaga oryziterrae TaxID=1031224 RepID=A0A6N8J9S5_9BACT|nr:DUF6520 family protein [Chitinophaga oryziterrae]MVT41980.1 hypothetical protein [Chitinophaga oryziterrae]